MPTNSNFILRAVAALAVFLILSVCQSCEVVRSLQRSGLEAGINYMQPMKWRMTCYYRVQEITAERPFIRPKPSKHDPDVLEIGPGTYEVWMVTPREGEELFALKEIYAEPKPTEIASTPNGDAKFYYYNFAPDGKLPQDITAAVQWEFVTFERYAFLDDLEIGEYDKEGELYKRYTKAEKPITLEHPVMQKAAKECIDPEHPDDTIATAHSCYDYICEHFKFEGTMNQEVIDAGRVRLQDTWRCWENQSGFSEEYANVFCAMLRNVGIPARPCTGLCHPPDLRDADGNPLMEARTQTWAEFYVPSAGWIPVDPAMGQRTGMIDPLMSRIGASRKLTLYDYYFGKHDSLRIPYNKHWNLALSPKPVTPGADPIEPWTLGFAHRHSGIMEMHHGWEGEPGTFGGG